MTRQEIKDQVRIKIRPWITGKAMVEGIVQFGASYVADDRYPQTRELAEEHVREMIVREIFGDTDHQIRRMIDELKGDIALECRHSRRTIFGKLHDLELLVLGLNRRCSSTNQEEEA